MARDWTEAQRAAINTRDRTLLVSAAAGSGKTATLTQRIIESLTDEEAPADISRMLIVTFTNAAAAELRSRISENLLAAIASRGRDARLSRQLLLLPTARISTIDSFCLDVLRKNAAAAGLSPSFRVTDEGEARLLEGSVMEQFLDDLYDGVENCVTSEELFLVAESLADPRHPEALSEALLSLYRRAHSLPRSSRTLLDLCREFSETEPVFETPAGTVYYNEARLFCDHYLRAYDGVLLEMQSDAELMNKYGAAMQEDRAMLASLAGALDALDYGAVRGAVSSYELPALSRLRGGATPLSFRAKAIRDAFREDKRDLAKMFVYRDEAEWKAYAQRASHGAAMVAQLLVAYEDRLLTEKRRRSLVSFADIEAYTYRLLIDEAGEPTAIAHDLAAAFDQIYIDEYQDINPVQHGIFCAISTPRNRFMVGDIKQSIYGFRHAEPDIFANMKKSFGPLSAGKDEAQISMSKNFRSKLPVIDLVNSVFDTIFGIAGNSIGYDAEADRLVAGNTSGVTPLPKIAVFDNPKYATEDCGDERREYKFIADEIARLTRSESLADGEPIKYKDIAIIVRGNSHAKSISEYLESRGIPTLLSDGGEFFSSPEVLLALSLFGTIDNPRRDVDLAATLMSPIYDLTLDDLIEIRSTMESAGEPLIETLRAYFAEHPDDSKVGVFLSDLARYRHYATTLPVDKLIWKIYHEKAMLSLDGGGARRGLLALYDYARRFTSSSFKGVYNFISYIREMIASEKTLPLPVGSSECAVSIITCHHSKGLEYPVCFISECGRDIGGGSGGVPAFDGEIGCAFALTTLGGAATEPNPLLTAIKRKKTRREFNEELRVLYVALTRPRERLYITATCPLKDTEKYIREEISSKAHLDEFSIQKKKCYLSLILSSADESCYELYINPTTVGCEAPVTVTEASVSSEVYRDIEDALRSRFDWGYEYEYLRALPSKLSVSRLSPTVLDGTELYDAIPAAEEETGDYPVPEFIAGERTCAAERGTATHNFLQFCNFEHLRTNGAEAELRRLLDGGFLPDRARELVDLKEIECFARSALFDSIIRAKRIYRELRFNIMLPAAKFTGNEALTARVENERLLVQGVIDCAMVEGDEVTLIDYKTDRLTGYELANPDAALKKLEDRHKEQLSYYREACRRMFNTDKVRVLIYSLHAGRAFEIGTREI